MKEGTKDQFTAQGLQTAVMDRNNNTTTYAYDGQNRLTTITDPAGQVTTFTEKSQSGVRSPRAGSGLYFANCTRTLKDGTKFQFTAQGFQTAVTDRNNNTTTYAYDGQNRLTTITDPAGQVTTFAYSGNATNEKGKGS